MVAQVNAEIDFQNAEKPTVVDPLLPAVAADDDGGTSAAMPVKEEVLGTDMDGTPVVAATAVETGYGSTADPSAARARPGLTNVALVQSMER